MRALVLALALLVAACAAPDRPPPYQDIVDAYNLRLEQLLVAVDRGQITPKEAEAMAAQYEAEANMQMELRRAARTLRYRP